MVNNGYFYHSVMCMKNLGLYQEINIKNGCVSVTRDTYIGVMRYTQISSKNKQPQTKKHGTRALPEKLPCSSWDSMREEERGQSYSCKRKDYKWASLVFSVWDGHDDSTTNLSEGICKYQRMLLTSIKLKLVS